MPVNLRADFFLAALVNNDQQKNTFCNNTNNVSFGIRYMRVALFARLVFIYLYFL